MSRKNLIILFLLVVSALAVSLGLDSSKIPGAPISKTAQEPVKKASYKLSNPLIGDDGRVYTCSERSLFAFESNGSIAWTLPLNYTCNDNTPPIHSGRGKIYLVAENKVIKISRLKIGNSETAAEVFFGTTESDEIIGISLSTLNALVFINVKSRGLFAYTFGGQLLWSAGPVLYRFGYRQGCRKNVTDCYFASVPVVDHCEATLYIANTEGELYALSVRSTHFKWIQDLSSFDKKFKITAGNNGLLYVTIPAKALILALDVFTGNVLWERSVGPLSTTESAPIVDSNGWLSIGSLDGYLYSVSPTGLVKDFSKIAARNFVIQVSPLLDCSGYAVYLSQTEMEGKITRTIGEYTHVSGVKPTNAIFTVLVPATGSIYWSESYNGQFSTLLSESDLHYFVVDERILLAFITASKMGNPLPCRTTRQKLASSCSQAKPKHLSIYTGDEKAILLFLLFESAVLIVLAVIVRFCCIFWRKKKLKGQQLGKFLEKRHLLRQKKKAFDRTITELEQKAAEEAVSNEVLEKLGTLVRERGGIERKLSTTYSLGRDKTGSKSKSILPLYDGKTKSYSFQGARKESVTIFNTLDTSSRETSSEGEPISDFYEYTDKAKAKTPSEIGSSSDDLSLSESTSRSKGFVNPLYVESAVEEHRKMKMQDGSMQSGERSIVLKRRRTLSSTN